MYIARKSPYFKRGFLGNLFECELCLGVWVYSFLCLLLDFHLPQSTTYLPILSEILAGMVMSFSMWLLTEGWNAKFRNIYLE